MGACGLLPALPLSDRGRYGVAVKVWQFSDIDAFADEVGGFLLAHETEHCLSLGLLSTLREPDGPYVDTEPYLAAVFDERAQWRWRASGRHPTSSCCR